MLQRVVLTKHAVERLFERFPREEEFKASRVVNIVESVLKGGVTLKRGEELRVSTSRYTLCCSPGEKLVVKTVLKTFELGKPYRRAMAKAEPPPWRNVFIENLGKVKKWCEELEKMKNICKTCGVSKEQTPIERCKIYGFYICSFCCESIGGYSERCKGCTFDVVHIKTKTIEEHGNPTYV